MRTSLRIHKPIVCILVALVAVLTLPSVAGASTISSHSVPGLTHCAESRSCDIKNAGLHFVNYSTVCSYSDCNFVAAADWEKVALHSQPSANMLKNDYEAAHQTFAGGLHMPDLWSYWKQSGVDGAYATKVSVWSHAPGAVQNGVLHFGALIAGLQVSKNSTLAHQFGVYNAVIAVVDGFDSVGPLIVFKTKTTQATWAQWNLAAQAAWGISTSSSPPTPPPTTTTTVAPTTTTTVAPTTTTTLAQSASVTFNANGGSGAMANETETLGAAVALTPNAFVFSGYSFNDWNTAPDGTGTSYANGAIYSFAASVTLYAQWTASSPSTPFTGTETLNWSGYVLPSSSIVTETSAQWTVPNLNCADTVNADSSTWVGTGGVTWSTGGISGQLLQTGTEDDCVNGAQHDYGWWELYPVNAAQPFMSYPVLPGDSMEAYVYQDLSGTWVTLLNNLTTGLSATMVIGGGWGVGPIGGNFTEQGTTTGWTYAGAYSAEWIVEDNESALTNALNPFANYGSVAFSNITTNLSPSYLTADDGVEIVQNGVALSVPSPIVNGGFTVTYMGP
jgi:hypothetical protein